MSFSDHTTRCKCIFLSKHYSKILTTEASFRWRLERLHIEHGICPPHRLRTRETWGTVFRKLILIRSLWSDSLVPSPAQVKRIPVHVSIRIKPMIDQTREDDDNKKDVTLPLHQRLALIKINNEIESNSDAIQILAKKGAWFGAKWAERNKKRSIDGKNGFELESEKAFGHCKTDTLRLKRGIHAVAPKEGKVITIDSNRGVCEYQFPLVFDASAKQCEIHDCCSKRLLHHLVNGYNCTLFAYGQTGSGKTYTMNGPDDEVFKLSKAQTSRGIIPRMCSDLLELIGFRQKRLNIKIQSSITVTYVEIFGNSIHDLLKNGKSCGQNRATAQRNVLSGGVEVCVSSLEEIQRLLQIGESQKRKAATAMNKRSTRAHSLFILTLHQHSCESNVSLKSKLFLVDLGGSEKTKKSKIEPGKSTHLNVLKNTMGGTLDFDQIPNENQVNQKVYTKDIHSTGFVQSHCMREAIHINLGLMALKSCVEALNSNRTHVPYANSKLTQLLSEGLGGNSRTSIIVCVAQEVAHTNETIAALDFGRACTGINNKLIFSSDPIKSSIVAIDKQIAECEREIKAKERWVVREDRRVDRFSIGSERIETERRKTTILVGAEKERRNLEQLMRRKAMLLGSTFESVSQGKRFGGEFGFGNANEYGLGLKYIAGNKSYRNNRFLETTNLDDLPAILKSRGTTSWNTDCQITNNKQFLNCKRSKFAYSGISA
mmetsp:Transcript_22545/g.28908  ORF Transcript_22545/g.28908 Transcript_22545/m.28908 type:complete len:714 (-) Transcript_22545:1236-3377(-)